MTPDELYSKVKETPILTRAIIDNLMESLDYNSMSFINQTVEVLKMFKTRIVRGDQITDEVSKKLYTYDSFRTFVKRNFSAYIYDEVFSESQRPEKTFFTLEPCESGYKLLMADDGKQKIYEWISSLSEKFSLVFMIATKVVYIKNIKAGTYAPLISENGKYCRYDKSLGIIVEIE